MNNNQIQSKIKILTIVILQISYIVACKHNSVETPIYKSKNIPVEERVEDLLNRMTLEEKIGQLSQIYVVTADSFTLKEIREGKVSSLLNGLDTFYSPSTRNLFQKEAVENSRLGIPLIFGHDVVHGFRTIFPISLAQSCTWSPELHQESSRIAAREASTYGIDWTFAPMVEVSRDSRWGRVAECYGEDPYLNSIFGVAAVKGFQGNDVSQPYQVVSCLKHYVGYSVSEGGRDYQYTPIPERDMQEIYLKPFKSGIEAGALTVMSAFNDINGIPATSNELYLRKTLKEKWGFQGFVVSDWDAVVQLIDHGIAADTATAAMKAFSAGVDMEMKSLTYQNLKSMVEQGIVSIPMLNESVKRILRVKFLKGLFDNPYTDTLRMYNEILTAEHRSLSRRIARESMVLLKNDDGLLPLDDKNQELAIVGPFSNEKNLMGWWKSMGNANDLVSPLHGLKLNTKPGTIISEKISKNTDAIIVCLGETREMFGEYHSRSDISLPEHQLQLLKELQKHSKPIITVIFNGRPLDLTEVIKFSNSVLIAWHPGTEAGNALSDILYGNYNPSGKLTMSFPKSTGQVPIYYNHRNSGRPDQSNYIDLDAKPLFPFGYGMSYTTFVYSNLQLSSQVITIGDSLLVSANVANTGQLGGEEIVQLYIRDLVGSTTRPVKELKGFKKVFLNPGESKEIQFLIHSDDLVILNEDFNSINEPGDYYLWIAPTSEGGLKGEFKLTK